MCSRNVRQIDIKQKCFYDDNVYYQIAQKYNIKNVLTQLLEHFNCTTVVLQGETIGTAIQKNKYRLDTVDFYGFNLVVDGRRINSLLAKTLLNDYGVKWVPILDDNFILKTNR